jgi:uncharacterized protein
MSIFWTSIIMGLMGGFHCVGMCGPIALSLPDHHSGSNWKYVQGRVFYNLGRVATYAGMGIIFGFFGFALNLAGLQQWVSILSGVLILILQFAPGNLSGKISSRLKIPVLVGKLKASFKSYFAQKGSSALFIIGLLNGLLPCGFVYLALAGSLATGSVTGAALYMALFGLGTLPVMLAISLSGKLITFSFRSKIQKAVPYVATAIALLFILRGLSLGIPYVSPKLGPHHQHQNTTTEITTCH